MSMFKETIKKHLAPFIIGVLSKLINMRKFFLFPPFFYQYFIFKQMHKKEQSRFTLDLLNMDPRLGEATEQSDFDHHYIFHPAWAARILAKFKPNVHVDIGSSLSFSTIVSAFMPIKFYDYRPADLSILGGLETGKADLLNLFFDDNSIHSLSCMHVVEHVGLGRYGDHLDPNGDLKAINELIRVLAPGGSLLFVVPIGGHPKIQFNAHRIYSYDQVLNYFLSLELEEFSLIRDYLHGGGLLVNARKEIADEQEYGCGCFWFKKVN